MRPLILISRLSMGGAERVTVSFVIRAAAAGVHPTVCTLSSRWDGDLARELEVAGIDRRDLGARRLASPVGLVRLLLLLRRERFDLVHAHGQDASILARLACRLTATPLVVTRHVLEEPLGDWRQRLRARLALGAARAADRLVAVSSACADWLAEAARVRHSTVRVIHNGIDPQCFEPAALAARGAAIRADLGFDAGDRLVLIAAALREGKGHEVLIEALAEILAEIPRVRVLFAGAGERERHLRRLARPHGDRIRFLGECSEMARLLAASDVVVLPSDSEAFPTTLLEAAAAGRPVVATNVGGSTEIVEDGITGFLIPPRDATALAAAVCRLLADRTLADSMGRAAHRRVRSRFTLDRQLESTFALWHEVATTR